MKFAIINKETLEIKGQYEADKIDNTSVNRSWLEAEPICCHLEIGDLVHFKAEKTPIMATITVVDEVERTETVTIPAITHTETNVIVTPEHTEQVLVPAVTHEEIITVIDTPAWTDTILHPDITHEEIVIDVPESVDGEGNTIPAVTHTETIVDTPEWTETIEHPAITHEETITVVDIPEHLEDVLVPESSREETLVIVDVPEHTEEVFIPAVTHEEEVITDYTYSLVHDADKEVAAIEATKQAQVSALYNQKNADIDAQMFVVFNTNKPESATRQYETWKLMLNKPDMFLDGCGFSDEATVVAYANEKIASAEAYAVWCTQKTLQFYADRSAILGG